MLKQVTIPDISNSLENVDINNDGNNVLRVKISPNKKNKLIDTPEGLYTGGGVKRGAILPYYRVTFGGSDGRRAIFWGETEADEDYILCDGGSDGQGGTVPDLRDKMIMCAGAVYAAGSTGGNSTHSHTTSGSVGATTLTEAQLASHRHNIICGLNYGADYNRRWISATDDELDWHNNVTEYTGSSFSHTHSLSNVLSNGSSNIPPFYALAFVILCR